MTEQDVTGLPQAYASPRAAGQRVLDIPRGPEPGQPDQADRLAGHHAQDGKVPSRAFRARLRNRQLLARAAPFILAIPLWFAYLRVSQTQPVVADGAAQALQAWDMLHGNLLLHGWTVSDVSFYTTELPEYTLVEAIRGLNAGVMHVAAATTYTLLVLLAALLAKGKTTGRQAVIRMLLAAGIVLAPQVGVGAYVLLLDPDHVGSSVVMMAILLLIDRTGRRMWVPVVVGLLLTWLLVADGIAVYTGVVPLLLVCGIRAYRQLVVRSEPVAAAAFEIAVGAAAAVAAVVASAVVTVLHAHGAYSMWSPVPVLVHAAGVPQNLSFGLEGVSALFGFDFFGMRVGLSALLAMLHVGGAAVALGAVWFGLRGFLREQSLVTQALVAAVVINLVGYLLSTSDISASNAREIAAVLPFSAVLAGRLLADKIVTARLTPVLVAGLLGYGVTLGYYVTRPALPPDDSQLTAWLDSHHYRYGLAGYWDANVVTLTSSGRVAVRPVCFWRQGFTTVRWEADASWYDSAHHDANFLVMSQPGRYGGLHSIRAGGFAGCHAPAYAQVIAAFGKPAHIYAVGTHKVLVWNDNLLTSVKN